MSRRREPKALAQKNLRFFYQFLFASRIFSESWCIDDLSFAYVYGDQDDDDGDYDGLLACGSCHDVSYDCLSDSDGVADDDSVADDDDGNFETKMIRSVVMKFCSVFFYYSFCVAR